MMMMIHEEKYDVIHLIFISYVESYGSSDVLCGITLNNTLSSADISRFIFSLVPFIRVR